MPGTGQSGYLPLAPEQTLQAEAGPQGGHHIWIAARMKNLKQAGSTTKIVGVQPETGTAIPPSTFVFTFSPDDGGYCKLYGLRYQLDNGGIDYKQFLGKLGKWMKGEKVKHDAKHVQNFKAAKVYQ